MEKQTSIKGALTKSLLWHNKRAKVHRALHRLFDTLYYLNRQKEAVQVELLYRKLITVNNKPALRAWALKARRVIGEIES